MLKALNYIYVQSISFMRFIDFFSSLNILLLNFVFYHLQRFDHVYHVRYVFFYAHIENDVNDSMAEPEKSIRKNNREAERSTDKQEKRATIVANDYPNIF